jgi:hypothetical protein
MIILGFNSLMICVIINYFFILPKEQRQAVNFRFSDDNRNLISEIYFKEISKHPSGINVCSIHECAYLEKFNYALNVEFEIANKIYPDNTNNYELELKLFDSRGDINYVRKLFYFEKYDSVLEWISKLASLPFRLLGYYKTQNLNLEMIEEYDNSYRSLEKIEISIKGKALNIRSCIFNFIPRIGFLRKLISYLRIVALPVLFFIIFLAQSTIILILVYFYRKPIARTPLILRN